MRHKDWLIFVGLVGLGMGMVQSALASYGVGAYMSTRNNSSEMTTSADRLGELGASWTRQEFMYDNIGGPSGTNYAADDEAADKARAKGVNILGLLNFATTPPSPGDWEAYVANVVSHFNGKVDAWEVLNEPNDTAQPSRYMAAATYNDYLARSYSKIKQFDPSATVVTAGVVPADVNWLDSLMAAGACSNFDALGIHPYRSDRPENVRYGEGDFHNYVGTAVAVVRRWCSGKKVWLTEFGYRTNEVGATNQANWLARSFLLARGYADVGPVISYLLRDDGSDQWGVTDTSFAPRTAFSRVQQVFGSTPSSFSEEIVVTSRLQIDGFESTDGWGQPHNVNASAGLATTTGVFSNALQANYLYNASNAAMILTKEIPISGTPTALGLYLFGDDSRAIWRLRFKDANGETFQTLLGNGVSSWVYRQADLSNTGVMSSWEGDGVIQYPIMFHSLVLDRDSGASSGSVKVDALVAVTGSPDFRAVRYGSTVAAWKGSGSGAATVCGQSVTLSEEPIYLTGQSGCSSNGIVGVTQASATTPSSSATSSPSPSATKQKGSATASATPAPTPTVDAVKSHVTPDKWWAYATGADPITVTLTAVDSSGNPVTVSGWEMTGYRPSTTYFPPPNGTTPIVMQGTQQGVEEFETHLAGGITLVSKLRILWVAPTWQTLPAAADFLAASPDKVWVIDGSDPTVAAGTSVRVAEPATIVAVRAVLPGIEPVLVYFEVEGTEVTIPLERQDDGTYVAVVSLPASPADGSAETADRQWNVIALDAAGATIGELTGTLRLTESVVETPTTPPAETGIPPWVIYATGGTLTLAGLGYLSRARWLPLLLRFLKRSS